MTFWQRFKIASVEEAQVQHIRLLCWGWALAIVALLSNAALTTLFAIIMLVVAWIGAPESLEIEDESSSTPSEASQ